jgi:DNA helicase IV
MQSEAQKSRTQLLSLVNKKDTRIKVLEDEKRILLDSIAALQSRVDKHDDQLREVSHDLLEQLRAMRKSYTDSLSSVTTLTTKVVKMIEAKEDPA